MVDVKKEMGKGEMYSQGVPDGTARTELGNHGVIKQRPYDAGEAYHRIEVARFHINRIIEEINQISQHTVDPRTRKIYDELPAWLDRLIMAETTTIACGE